MSSKQRLIAAIERKVPDRLPVITHHIMQYFLDTYMNDIWLDEFFDYFGLNPIVWTAPYKPDESKGCYYDPHHAVLISVGNPAAGRMPVVSMEPKK